MYELLLWGIGAVAAGIAAKAAANAISGTTELILQNKEYASKQEETELEIEIEVETENKPTWIYRYGGTNPGNLTPSQRDVDMFPITGKGLSFSTIPKPGAAMTTIEALNATGVVYAVRDGVNHVSVFPVGGTLADWHNAGSLSVWTATIKSVVVKWVGGN